MASTRELWILLRARDEASRVVHSFAKNVRAAALAAQAAQKSAEAAAIRQQAQMLKSNGATAQQIRAINENVIGLEKQARAQTAAAARAREFRAEQMKSIDSQVRANNRNAANLERQARALSLAANMADEHRTSLIRLNGATNEATAQIDGQISSLRKRAATLNAEAAVARGASASLIAGLQEEQTGLDGSIRSHERRAAVLRAQAAEMRNQAAQLKVNLDDQVRGLTKQAAALDREANAFRQAANRAREHDIRIRKTLEGLGKVSEAATVAAFSLAAIGAGGLIGLKSAIGTAADWDRQVRMTKTQTGEFGASLKELSDIGKRVANDIAVPFEQIQPALFDIFSSMDVGLKDSERLLRAFSKAAVAGQTDIQAVSRATIGILNAFHRPATDVNKILDIQFQLVKLGIGTYEEWNQRIGLVTPSAVRAGQSIETMAAALATSTRMGISAARSGTAVARAMDAISHPAAVKNMEELGIKVRDAHGKFRPMNKILREFRDVLMKMPEKDRVKAILDVFKGAGGTIEARRFLQNILLGTGNLEAFDSILERVQNSSGSMEDAYKTMADSVSSKTELLRNKWQLLKQAIGEALIPTVIDLTERLGGLIDKFNKLPDSTKDTIAKFILFGSILTIIGGAIFGLIAVAATLTAAIATIGIEAAIMLGVVALIPAAILLIAYAMKQAYDKSEAFRNLFNSVKDLFLEVKDVVVGFANDVWTSFQQKVMPALQHLWQVIQDDLMPALQDFVDWAKDNLIPKLQEAANIVKGWLGTAFEYVGWIIENVVIPGIKDLIKTWEDNKEQLLPIINMLGQIAKLMLILAGGAIFVLITALASLAFYWRLVMFEFKIAMTVLAAISWAVQGLGDVIAGFWRWLKGLDWRGAWRGLSSGGQGAINALLGAFRALPGQLRAIANAAIGAVLAPFRGLPGQMSNLGRNAVAGFTSGLMGGRGSAAGAGAAIASAAYNAAKATLAVKSPSKKFKEIGYNVVQGFIKGINGSRSTLISTMNKLAHDVMASLKEGKASRAVQLAWSKKLNAAGTAILALETKRAQIATKINDAQKKLNDLLKARADLSQSIQDKLSESADITDIEAHSPQDFKAALAQRLQALIKFKNDLDTLRNKGLNIETVADLAQGGLDKAPLVALLSQANTGEIAEINNLQKQIRDISKSTGGQVAGQMYDAGVAAAQGLINGLKSQSAAITKQMTEIANALVNAIKKSLGIKSPSRVFMEIGKNTALGYLQGYANQMQGTSLSTAMLRNSGTPALAGIGSMAPTRTVHQEITINTREIDPRLHAAELGWELERRLP